MSCYGLFFFPDGNTGETHTHPSCCTSLLVLRMMSSSTGVWRRDQGDSSSCSGCVKLVTSNHDNTGNTRISLHNYNIHLNVRQREICVGRKYISGQSKFSFFLIFFTEKILFHIAYIEWGTIYSTYCVPVFQTATCVLCFLVPQGHCSNKHRKENVLK